MEWIELENGYKVPKIGYGTFQLKPDEVYDNVSMALKNGYCLIDTAASYQNEKAIGQAIQDSGIDRREIILATKVWVQDTGYEATLNAFERSLENLGTDYIDIYLIHQPYGDYYGSWRAMEQLYEQGKVKVIGVCNFCAERLLDLCLNAKISPMIDQVELHPFFQQKRLRATLPKGCRIEAWGPLNEGQRNIFANPALERIARKHHKTTAQVILRWHYQQDILAIPRSGRDDHQKENLDIFDFELDQEDFQAINALDLGYSEIIDHSDPLTVRILNTYRIHE